MAHSRRDWVWETVDITGKRERHLNPNNKRKSPHLIVNGKGCHLSVPFQIKTPQPPLVPPARVGLFHSLKKRCDRE